MQSKINKKYCMMVLAIAFFGVVSSDLMAQNTKTNTAPVKTDAVKKDAKTDQPVANPIVPKKFDPNKPLITETLVNDAIKMFKNKILEKNLPPNIKHHKTEDFITLATMDDISIRLGYIAKHPDLEEATGVPRAWYETLLPGVNTYMMDCANRMDLARLNNDDAKYQEAKTAFEKSQKSFLEFLEKDPPKLDKEAMKKIREANSKRRQKEFEEQLKKAPVKK